MTAYTHRVPGEGGFALVSALLIALLFFGLIELTLRDTSDGIRAAHRHRDRIASEVLADNAVELAAAGMLSGVPRNETRSSRDGAMAGAFHPLPGFRFELTGEGTSAGLNPTTTRVVLRGRIDGSSVVIEESETR